VRALVWAGIALVTFGWVWLAVLWVPNVVVGVVLAVLALSLVAGVIDWARQGDFRPLDAPVERGTHAVRDDAPAEAG
jgi:xanthine/uracil permease